MAILTHALLNGHVWTVFISNGLKGLIVDQSLVLKHKTSEIVLFKDLDLL